MTAAGIFSRDLGPDQTRCSGRCHLNRDGLDVFDSFYRGPSLSAAAFDIGLYFVRQRVLSGGGIGRQLFVRRADQILRVGPRIGDQFLVGCDRFVCLFPKLFRFPYVFVDPFLAFERVSRKPAAKRLSTKPGRETRRL